jgi:hypothetical protein
MTGRQSASSIGRSNLRGAIITLVLEAVIFVALAIVGIGVSSLMLWLA